MSTRQTMKIEMYGKIKEEAGVVMAFSKMHKELGFPKLVPSSSRGFDIDDIGYKNGKRVTVEFEYLSENFINHGHVEKMKDGRDYVLICYEDNCNIISRVRNEFRKSNLELIELKKYIEVKEEKIIENQDSIEYIVLNYNPHYADNLPIGAWTKTNVYRSNVHFAGNKIMPGSKILFKQGNYIVASCEVVRYEIFDEPKSENEWKIYHALHSYPMGIFNDTLEETKNDFTAGHIFYDEFQVFEERKVSFKETLPDKNMSQHGMIKITREEYNKLLGL